MDVDIIEEDENPMLHRTDVRFELTHDEASPSRLSVRDSLAAKLNKDSTEVVIHELDTKFGMRTTVGYAKVYDTPEDALEIEQDYMLERNKITTDGETEAAEAEDEAEEAEAEEEETEPEATEEEAEEEAGEAEAETDEESAEEADEAETEEAEAPEDEADEAEAEEA